MLQHVMLLQLVVLILLLAIEQVSLFLHEHIECQPNDQDSDDSDDYAGLVSPKRRDQGQTLHCAAFAGATFIRAALKRHFPEKERPRHKDLKSDIVKRLDCCYQRQNVMKVMKLVCNEHQLSFQKVERRKVGWELTYAEGAEEWDYNTPNLLHEMRKHWKNNQPLFVGITGSCWSRILWGWEQKILRGEPSNPPPIITLDDVMTYPFYVRRGFTWILIKVCEFRKWWNPKFPDEIFPGVCHAVVFDPEATVEGKWAFKNSHGDGLFYIDDKAMRLMISRCYIEMFAAEKRL